MKMRQLIKASAKVGFSVIFTASTSFANSSASNTRPRLSEQDQAKYQQYKNYLEPLGYELNVDVQKRMTYVVDKNTKKLAMEIPMESSEKLKNYAPNKMNEALKEHMNRMKLANKTAWEHSYKNMPTESAVFFMAMGAVMAGQLMANYSANPVAMQQHIEHSMSPVGVMSFWMFMYSQGVTQNVMMMYLKNPKFHHFIPYLGMTVGAFVQSYISTIAADPNVKACAATLIGGKVTESMKQAGASDKPCDNAYEHLVLSKKIWEFAPGIVSMLTSSALAGALQWAVTKTALRLTGVDIAMWIMPGSIQVKGLRLWLVKGLQLTFFVTLDTLLIRHVTFAWKNLVDAADLHDVNDSIVEEMALQKKSKWNNSSDKFVQALKDLRKKGSDWRMTNLAEVYESHQFWSESLNKLTGLYNTSYTIYSHFANALNSAKQGKDILGYSYPLYGVEGINIKPESADIYHSYPQMTISAQMAKVQKIAEDMKQGLESDQYAQQARLTSAEISQLHSIQKKFASNDPQVMAKGISELAQTIASVAKPVYRNLAYEGLLRNIQQNLGKNPRPLLEKGRGFLATYEDAPSNAQMIKGTAFPKSAGAFITPRLSDYITVQMICGPDVEQNESVVKQVKGFSAKFNPPTIRAKNDRFDDACESMVATRSMDDFFNTNFLSANGTASLGPIDYLKKNARPEVTSGIENFDKWWNANTEAQMQREFKKYESSYSEIVGNMLNKIYRNDDSKLNRGPLANGIYKAALQELRMNQMILGEILKDQFSIEGKALDKTLLDPKMEEAVRFTKDEAEGSQLPLLQLFERSSTLEWNRLAQPFNKVSALTNAKAAPIGYRLKIQSEIEAEFKALNALIEQIKVQNDGEEFKVISAVSNSKFEEQLNKVYGKIAQFESMLGVKESQGLPEPNEAAAVVQLNASQKEIAKEAIENMKTLASEISMFGTIANSVTWAKIRQIEDLNSHQSDLNKKVQSKIQGPGRLTPGLN